MLYKHLSYHLIQVLALVGLDSFRYRFVVSYVTTGITVVLYSTIFCAGDNFYLRMSVVLIVFHSISLSKFSGVSLSSWYSPKYL